MKLRLIQSEETHHSDIVVALNYVSSDDLYSASDDKTLWRWNSSGESTGQFAEFDSHITDMQWLPTTSGVGRAGVGSSDLCAVACSDGSFRLVGRTGREEKRVEAHNGAVLCMRWNRDGSALVTGGEDGLIKQWSAKGMLRSQLVQSDHPVYTIVWGPNSQQILYSSGMDIIIKPLRATVKQIAWKAHEGAVLKADWNPITSLIVSCGEDCRYKVWDSFGRLLHASGALEHVVTAVSWSPDGSLFAAGSFNVIRLCDKTGWTHAREMAHCGSIYSFDWSSDGTQLAAGTGTGDIVHAHLIHKLLEWQNYTALIEEPNRVIVTDIVTESGENLDFKDPVVQISLGYGHLVVSTSKQCYVYETNNFNTPHIFDLKVSVKILKQSQKFFLVVDKFGVHVYTYEGRLASKLSRNTDRLSEQRICMANDCFAVVDQNDESVVNVYETRNGKPLGPQLKHTTEVVEIGLDSSGPTSERKLTLIDSKRDLHITSIMRPEFDKLGGMIECMIWNDKADMLAALSVNKLTVWYYPNVVFIDKDLVGVTTWTKETTEYGKGPILSTFSGSMMSIRRCDGALIYEPVSPHVIVLQEHVSRREWDRATRLCRFAKDDSLWACLAAMSLAVEQLDTAEVALAAIDEVDKLHYLQHVQKMKPKEAKTAAIAFYRGDVIKAETILLQAGYVYRAIKMNIRSYRWDRAIELAAKYKVHVDTVLAHRAKYLENNNLKETNERFIQYSKQGITIDWEKIKRKAAADKDKPIGKPAAVKR